MRLVYALLITLTASCDAAGPAYSPDAGACGARSCFTSTIPDWYYCCEDLSDGDDQWIVCDHRRVCKPDGCRVPLAHDYAEQCASCHGPTP
jgi:hypothetical protein